MAACLWPAIAPAQVAADTFGRRLQHAESLRSAEPAQFRQELEALERDAAAATREQRLQLKYLQSYRDSYEGRYAASSQRARDVADNAADPALRYRAQAMLVANAGFARDFTTGLRELQALQAMPVPARYAFDGAFVAAVLYDHMGQHSLALKNADAMLRGSRDPRELCLGRQLRYRSIGAMGRLDPDDPQLAEAIAACRGISEFAAANFILLVQARQLANTDPARAIRMLDGATADFERAAHPRLSTDFHATLAELIRREGDLRLARMHGEMAVKAAGENIGLEPMANAYLTLERIAETEGRIGDALALHKKYAEADKAYLNDVRTRELAYQLVSLEMQQKNRRIDLLERDNQLLGLQREVSTQRARAATLLAVVLAILMALAAYWFWRKRKVDRWLLQQSRTDALTGVSNRQHFSQCADAALARCRREGLPAALVMFDLDNFKTINDTHGSEVGDLTLKRVANDCRQQLAEDGACMGRVGSEEFAVLFPGMDHEAARMRAERFRTWLADRRAADPESAAVTASFGIACTAVSGYALDTLLSNADAAMYQSKRSGRNRVTVSPH